MIEIDEQTLRDHALRMQQLSPVRLSAEKLRAIADDDLLDLLTFGGDGSGTLYASAAQAITAELLRRQIKRGPKPHKPTFWVAVVAALTGVVSVVLAAQPYLSPAAQPVAIRSAVVPAGAASKPATQWSASSPPP